MPGSDADLEYPDDGGDRLFRNTFIVQIAVENRGWPEEYCLLGRDAVLSAACGLLRGGLAYYSTPKQYISRKRR